MFTDMHCFFQNSASSEPWELIVAVQYVPQSLMPIQNEIPCHPPKDEASSNLRLLFASIISGVIWGHPGRKSET